MQNKSSTVIVASVPVVGTLQTIKLFTFLTWADCQMATCASNTFLVVISPNIFKQVYHQAPDSSLVKYFLKLTAKVQALKKPRLKSQLWRSGLSLPSVTTQSFLLSDIRMPTLSSTIIPPINIIPHYHSVILHLHSYPVSYL